MREMIVELIRNELVDHRESIADLHEAVEETQRRLSNMIRVGVCQAASSDKVRVQHGQNFTPWIKWFAPCAGEVREYRRPSVGEQCLLLNYAAGNNSSQTFALFGLFSSQYPPPTNRASQHQRIYPDGTEITYDHEIQELTVMMQSGNAVFKIPNKVKIDSNEVHLTGKLNVDKNITSKAEISDSKRAMSADRAIYNVHKHPHGLPNTSVPVEQQ